MRVFTASKTIWKPSSRQLLSFNQTENTAFLLQVDIKCLVPGVGSFYYIDHLASFHVTKTVVHHGGRIRSYSVTTNSGYASNRIEFASNNSSQRFQSLMSNQNEAQLVVEQNYARKSRSAESIQSAEKEQKRDKPFQVRMTKSEEGLFLSNKPAQQNKIWNNEVRSKMLLYSQPRRGVCPYFVVTVTASFHGFHTIIITLSSIRRRNERMKQTKARNWNSRASQKTSYQIMPKIAKHHANQTKHLTS